jgi:competence protein ComEA
MRGEATLLPRVTIRGGSAPAFHFRTRNPPVKQQMQLTLPIRSLVGTAMLAAGSVALAAHPVPKVPASPSSQAMTAAPKPVNPVKPVDLNNASRAELKTLPGIGDAEVDRIVKGRPYLSKTIPFTNGVLPESMYATLKSSIVVKEPKSPGWKSPVRQAAAGASKPSAAPKP